MATFLKSAGYGNRISPLGVLCRRASPGLVRRHVATSAPKITSSVYISEATDPYFNLTIEDWLFKNAPEDRPLLLIYRNTPCVVIGRNQNPWKEVNFRALRQTSVPFIRRRSGGGAVYHDLGNTNYSIHIPRTAFDRKNTSQVVLRAVQALGIPAAYLNERNDVCVEGRKITYKIVAKRAYHHGTMLIAMELGSIGKFLRPENKDSMITKGVASVRSPVGNLQRFNASASHEAFCRSMVSAFLNEYRMEDEPQFIHQSSEYTNLEAIARSMSELKSWDWTYGQTPEFSYAVSRVFPGGVITATVRSKRGVIEDCKISLEGQITEYNEALSDLGHSLEGERFGFTSPRFLSASHPEYQDQLVDVHRWLVDDVLSER
ncbi:Lipoyltransferase and lipoate-protein ligase [Fistulina hepatica ATCC 64428]|uniref:Putative lipoate-protein ligase A n=1 Tax=Fistulina hepatica ATCC 64428 TaxID=1128425 RepID=A0A0D7AJ83_9AGAR|nr:Lipoyltransferase and lipoate-protein ligase [Fistulina hepatica ATCC 64428]